MAFDLTDPDHPAPLTLRQICATVAEKPRDASVRYAMAWLTSLNHVPPARAKA